MTDDRGPRGAVADAGSAELIAAQDASLAGVNGWRAYGPLADEPAGEGDEGPAHVWRRFHLSSLAVLPGLVLVDLRWAERHLAELRLLIFIGIGIGDADAAAAAAIVRTALERHLAGRWRERLVRTRLDDGSVVRSKPGRLLSPRPAPH